MGSLETPTTSLDGLIQLFRSHAAQRALPILCSISILNRDQFTQAPWPTVLDALEQAGFDHGIIDTVRHLHQGTNISDGGTPARRALWPSPASSVPAAQLDDTSSIRGAGAVMQHVRFQATPWTEQPRQPRRDFPTIRKCEIVRTSKLTTALAVAETPDSRDRAISQLEADRYAQSSRGPVDARWETWCSIARAWGMPPLPVTPELVQKLAASFKCAGYRSAAMYFSLARQRHQMQYDCKVSPYTDQCIRDYSRSIGRGLGGAQAKQGFILENLVHATNWMPPPASSAIGPALPSIAIGGPALPSTDEHGEWRTRIGSPPWWSSTYALGDAPSVPETQTILGCWFLTREIELAAAMAEHMTIDWSRMTVSWLLPSSKTDCAAVGTTRQHGCSCSPARSCAICPFHNAAAHLQRQREFWDFLPEINNPEPAMPKPLFPHVDGLPQSKHSIIKAIRQVAAICGSKLTEDTENNGRRELFGGHGMRVSGAQMLGRHGVELYMIQLMGRWGSSAVAKYVQDAPLHLQTTLAAYMHLELSKTDSVEKDTADRAGPAETSQMSSTQWFAPEATVIDNLTSMVAALREDVMAMKSTERPPDGQFIRNCMTGYIHRPSEFEAKGSSSAWKAKGCKWMYGRHEYDRINTMPADPLLCPGCFGLLKKRKEPSEAASETSQDTNSDSSSSDS